MFVLSLKTKKERTTQINMDFLTPHHATEHYIRYQIPVGSHIMSNIHGIYVGNEQVITVVGCGGDRDSAKRPVMAKIACEFSNKTILTSDNPRSENPEEILNQMQSGLSPVEMKSALRISDRKEAIKTAVAFAKEGDILLIAGKGHEKYQEINGVKHHFDDFEIIKELFETQTL